MSNELIIPGDDSTDLDVFDRMSSMGTGYLPYLQLCSAKTAAAGDGRIPVNHYGLVNGDDIVDIGSEIIVAVLAVRDKAMCTSGDVKSSFDPESELFKDFVTKSAIKNSGYMFGPEFLFYVPSVSGYCTYFAGSPTARRAAKKFKPLMKKPAKMTSKTIERNGNKWRGPVVLPSDEVVELPDMDKAKLELDKFRNPPKDSVEVAPEDSRER